MKDKESKINKKENLNDIKNCGCNEGKECNCGEDCQCEDDCTCHKQECCHEKNYNKKENDRSCCCEDDCNCDDSCDCDDNCGCHSDRAGEYLAIAQRLQADFDNYRKRVAEQLDYQKQEGIKSVIEVFLPCLDTFKDAKKSIADAKVLTGVNMIEEKIYSALKTLNIDKIESIGKVYNPHLHNAIAVMKDESKENDIILEEYQAGYTLQGKVIRYSKVIVNKREE